MAKILKSGIISIIMSIMITAAFPITAFSMDYEPRLTAPQGEAYYTSELNVYSRTGYGMPNCVAYAYGRLYELNGEAPKLDRGDAGQWWFINESSGYYEYGDEPRLGAVACWSNHVAIVEEISEDGSVTISESHWGGDYFDIKTYSDISSHYGQTFYGYIYAYTEDEEESETYAFDDYYFEPQEKNCINALEFKAGKNVIMNPNNSFLLSNQ